MHMKLALTSLAAVFMLAASPLVTNIGHAATSRPTFQCITPTNCPGPNYVAFNSFTNAPNYGDERAFLDAKDALITSPGGWQDRMSVRDGQRVVMRIYIHNNANEHVIGAAAATAKNTSMQVILPTNSSTTLSAAANISADNANPRTVSDTVDFDGAHPFTIKFDRTQPVEVTYRPNGTGDFVTRPLPGAMFANDQTLNANFGDWRGCFEFAALVTFTAVVSMPTPPTPPAPTPPPVAPVVKREVTRLPVTGPASTVGLFAGVSALAGVSHYLYRRFVS